MPVLSGAPATYEQCLRAAPNYHSAAPTDLECAVTITNKNEAAFQRCRQLGGTLSSLAIDDFVNYLPDVELCALRYYNERYLFPQSFEECVASQPEWLRALVKDRGTCSITIQSSAFGVTNVDVADTLMSRCIARGGKYVAQGRACTVQYDKDSSKVN